MATTKTKNQTDFYSAEKYQYLTKFYEDHTQDIDKILRKYQLKIYITSAHHMIHHVSYNIHQT